MLLDTCALLWLVHDQKKLRRETLQKMDQSPLLCVSSISGFEIGLKYNSGKLKLPVPPRDWFSGILEFHDISVIGLDMEICLKATELPFIHRDPCDRFIIATAMLRELPVITTDKRFARYGVEILM